MPNIEKGNASRVMIFLQQSKTMIIEDNFSIAIMGKIMKTVVVFGNRGEIIFKFARTKVSKIIMITIS